MDERARPKCQIIKIQRPAFQKERKLLIYSEDGMIPISLVPDEGDFKAALGDRIRACFKYTMDTAGRIILGEEVYRHNI